MKVGDYVRLKDGTIDKILLIQFAEDRKKQYPTHPSKSYWRDKIVLSKKHYWQTTQNVSKVCSNIIDLIEVGDILYLEESDDIACMFFRDIYLVKNEDNLLNMIDDIKNKKCKLISIVTKEQFSSMEYKL